MIKKVLITGGCGFVGRHFTKHFLNNGHEVTIVDPLQDYTGAIDPLDWYGYKPLDNSNLTYVKDDCRNFFRDSKENFDMTVHLAAFVGGREAIDNDPLAVAVDLSIDAEYWRYLTNQKTIENIYFSSSAAYPINLQTKENWRSLSEEDIDLNSDSFGMPDMTYGWAKLTGEFLAKIAYEKYNIPSVVIRPFSGYGEDQDFTYPVPSLIRKIMNADDDEHVEVWGTGEQMRDFVHIDDVVRASLIFSNSIRDGSPVNISSGDVKSFNEFIEITAKVVQKKIKIKPLIDKPVGVFSRTGSTEFQEKLGFSPKISLEEGIGRCHDFIEKYRT